MAKLRILFALSLVVTLGGCVVAPAPGYYARPTYVAPAPYYPRPYGYYRPYGWHRW